MWFIDNVFSFFWKNRILRRERKCKKTTATVSDVQKETVRERYKRNGRTKYRTKTRYIAYLNYEVNGVSYSNVELSSGACFSCARCLDTI